MVAEIIKGKPIPQLKRRGAAPKYPWLQLKPGEAFRFDDTVTFAGARSMASQHHGGATARWKFMVRQCDDGIYCWRVDGTPHELVNGNFSQTAELIENYGDTAGIATQMVMLGNDAAPRRGLPEHQDGDDVI